MVFKRFFMTVMIASAVIVGGCVLTAVVVDEFGLFRSAKGRTIGIYTSERTAKYFLSLRYVPDNFDAILIGPSLSDQLDTRQISAYRMYNLSLLGANAVELDLLVQNVLTRKAPKALLICIDPFLFRNAELMDARMTPRIRWTVLGSSFIFDYYLKKYRKIFAGKRDLFEYTPFGSATINEQPVEVVRNVIEQRALKMAGEDNRLIIDPRALEKLKHTIDVARSNGTRIYAFFYPLPEPIRLIFSRHYGAFSEQMTKLFLPDDGILDFNTLKYKPFRDDPSNYVDNAHISHKGAKYLLTELDRMMLEGRQREALVGTPH